MTPPASAAAIKNGAGWTIARGAAQREITDTSSVAAKEPSANANSACVATYTYGEVFVLN